jgi:hypothetical protein
MDQTRAAAQADRHRALRYYSAASLVIVAGVVMAALPFPGGFDWMYTVISKLGSRSHNPGGGIWLSASLLCAVALLWPVAALLDNGSAAGAARARLPIAALRTGLIAAALLAVEGLLALDLSRVGRKAHEGLAIVAFLGLYGGVLGLHVQRMRHSAAFLWPAVLVVLPLCAVGLSQLALYFDQRELGWVSTAWRELGVPFWLSFAFWQWLAVALLGVGLGCLVLFRDGRPESSSPCGKRADQPVRTRG